MREFIDLDAIDAAAAELREALLARRAARARAHGPTFEDVRVTLAAQRLTAVSDGWGTAYPSLRIDVNADDAEGALSGPESADAPDDPWDGGTGATRALTNAERVWLPDVATAPA